MIRITTAMGALLAACHLQAQEISVSAINDTSYVVSGGVNESALSRSLVAAAGEYSFNDIFTGYIEGQWLRGSDGSADTGDIQAYSNIDEEDFSKLYEMWVEGNFSAINLRVKLGKVDANTEFAYVDHAGEFINSSMGFSPTIAFFPTYPNPTASANIFWGVSDTSTLSLGVYSDESDEFDEMFYISEWAAQLGNSIIKLGAWHQTGNINRLDTFAPKEGTTGYYAAAEGELSWQLFSSTSSGWFSQIGIADDTVSEIDLHLGAGLTWYGTFGREADTAGFAVTHVQTSQFLEQTLPSKETALEVFYKYQLNDYIAFKPDLQFIISPAATSEASDAIVLTLRSELSF